MSTTALPLVVDLDGTLIRTDLFYEAALRLIRRNPLNIFRLFAWALQGRSVAKDKVANRISINPARLPYESELVEYLKQQKASGRRLLLATAAHRAYAEKVAAHLGLFDEILATEVGSNLKGKHKLDAIQARMGDEAFAYAGDNAADRPIWAAASSAILVNAPQRDVELARQDRKDELVIRSRDRFASAFVQEMRPHQWAKNVLIFVPLVTAHVYVELELVLASLIAFACFSLCASGVYFANDLLDLEADRHHASKRNRPLAAGHMSIVHGLAGAIALPVLAFIVSLLALPWKFSAGLFFYYMTTNAYSLFVKERSTADVFTLAMLYTLRIFAGAAAISVALSSWLVTFSLFLFVSLAYLKRYVELAAMGDTGETVKRRGYTSADSETMFSLGVANIVASVVILAVYIDSAEIIALYKSPELLWLLCLIMLYWGNRIWIGARRGKITEDPVVFAVKDNISRLVGLCFVLVVLAARYLSI